MMRKAKDLSQTERDEIVRLSYGNSASILAEQFGTTKAVVLRIVRKARGKQLPWGERRLEVRL